MEGFLSQPFHCWFCPLVSLSYTIFRNNFHWEATPSGLSPIPILLMPFALTYLLGILHSVILTILKSPYASWPLRSPSLVLMRFLSTSFHRPRAHILPSSETASSFRETLILRTAACPQCNISGSRHFSPPRGFPVTHQLLLLFSSSFGASVSFQITRLALVSAS